MTYRLPFAYLSPVVDKLYKKQFDPSDTEGINKYCDFIVYYMRANGWTEEEYTSVLLGVPLSEQKED